MVARVLLAGIIGFLGGYAVCATLVVGQRADVASHVKLEDGWHVVLADGTVGGLV